jgi:hypothetical protein
MFAQQKTPIVFLACVNSYIQKKRTRYLVNERKQLSKILDQPQPNPIYHPIEKGNRPNSFFFKEMQSRGLHRKIEILHFVGHENGHSFKIESDDYETELSLDEVSTWVSRLSNLKLVYLQGCANEEFLNYLLKKDIPAIITCQTQSRNIEQIKAAQHFYKELSKGNSIFHAFQTTKRESNHIQEFSLEYDIVNDTIEGMPDKLPANDICMFYLEGNKKQLTAKPVRRRLIPLNRFNSKEIQDSRKAVRTLLLATAFGLVAALLTFLIANSTEVLSLLSSI